MESESTEISQETCVPQGFNRNFADSGVKSTELDEMVCCGLFLISTNEPSVLLYQAQGETPVLFNLSQIPS